MPTHLQVPVVDISPLVMGRSDVARVAAALGRACREWGFFYISGHGVDERLQQRLEDGSRRFFAQPLDVKMRIHMRHGGAAWRGYFPVGEELTAGKPDVKEGLYFGAELSDDHPLVQEGLPLHGRNLFPAGLPELRAAVLDYIDAMTRVGHAVMAGLAVSLGLPATYFAERYTGDPLVLFRIFNYPGDPAAAGAARWGVGEHTDYGFLTILRQDGTGGLQVKSRERWIDAPPLPNTFLCNIGDMLDRLTGGRYRSTPHRVQNVTRRDRLSWPFFFDPAFHAEVRPIVVADGTFADADRRARWDGASVHEIGGTYGDYLLQKVARVFPQLQRRVLARED